MANATETKLTERQGWTRLAELAAEAGDTAYVEYANERIAAINTRNGNRKMTAAQKENEGFKVAIVEAMEAGTEYTGEELGALVGITKNKAGALARQLVEAGVFTVADVKRERKDKDGKKRTATLKGYTLVEGATYTAKTDEVAETGGEEG